MHLKGFQQLVETELSNLPSPHEHGCDASAPRLTLADGSRLIENTRRLIVFIWKLLFKISYLC